MSEVRFARAALLSVSSIALGVSLSLGVTAAQAQQNSTEARPGATELPAVSVDAAKKKRRAARAAPSRESAPVVAQQPQAKPADTHDNRTGTVGYYANSTAVATKTNTPLLNIPQSVNVVTKDFIKDSGAQQLTDVTRYIPGVAIHQGEGNRDELVIRGVDSSANFFVNGFRDDVQYFRDLYNTQSIEVLKGPSALTFGRGAGGGLVNRTLKEADGQRIYEATAQTGSYGDRRISLDAGQAISQDFAVRMNAFYEGSDTFRNYGKLERYGINPTVTMTPNDTTKIKLSYEYYHDERTNDRGNPSYSPLGLPLTGPAAAVNAATMRNSPATPFAPNGNLTTFFGSPFFNVAASDVQTTMAKIEHDFENGLTVKSQTLYADYNRHYRNIYPGGGALAGAVNPAQTGVNLSAYENTTNRENLFNQTDFTYKVATGPIAHTIGFGTEFGRQTGLSLRNSGVFSATGTNTVVVNPFAPTYFGNVIFSHLASDANSKYRLNIESGYARDTIEITRWLQVIGGVRFDRFDLNALDMNTNTNRGRIDDKLSPSAAVIVKPTDNLSVYGMYSISYLPSSGDQFSALSNGTLILVPQKFETEEFGVKWQINPRLLYTAAIYNLNRTNQPVNDPTNAGFFLPNATSATKGFETTLAGYVTSQWQSQLGYAYTDSHITRDVSATVVGGNRVQLVPFNQFSWWNKYQIDERWAAAAGAIYFSDSYASSDNTVKLPSFWRFDAAVYAKIDETWRAQLNIENIFNTGYWASADSNNNISPGAPRTVRVSATAKF
ncbi:MAG: TonB-dependent siderophore receptor [Pseudomonadota bacterium]